MTERENLPAVIAAQDVVVLSAQRGSLVGRGLAAVENNKKLALTKNNDAIYRQARDVYNQFYTQTHMVDNWLMSGERLGSLEVSPQKEIQLPGVFRSFQQLAAEGYGKAFFPLYTLYNDERSINCDLVQAERLLKLAFDWLQANQHLNDPEIWYDLGVLYADENILEFEEENMKLGISFFRKAAEQGNIDGQAILGLFYGFLGAGGEAVHWSRKAAEQGSIDGQLNLGWMYADGNDGLEQDDEQAVYWYRKAAEQGSIYAQFNLGVMYQNGRGVGQDDGQAVYWYRKAAEQGYASGQNSLGWMYRNGRGVEQNDEQAVYWYRKAAEQGSRFAQNDLGWMYRDGRGVEQNDEQAVYWYRKSAEQGNIQAQNNLGVMYKYGLGVETDIDQAKYWYRKAASNTATTNFDKQAQEEARKALEDFDKLDTNSASKPDSEPESEIPDNSRLISLLEAGGRVTRIINPDGTELKL